MPIILRYEIRPDDRVEVRRLAEAAGVFSHVEIETAVELVDDRLGRGESSDYRFVFADRDGRTLGYACYGPIPLTAQSYDLYWIVVDKEHQRRGIGRLLLEKSEELVRQSGGRRIYVETSGRAQYAPTRDFYLRLGYRLDALLKDFYAPGDDKAIFVKDSF